MKADIKIYLQLGVGLLVAVIVAVGIAIGSSKQSGQAGGSGFIKAAEAAYDFGDIPIGGGSVSHEYKIKNDGGDPLTIKGMKTSCACTSAYIKYSDGRVSPKFSMHNNPAFYSRDLAPGEEASVITTFDPMFHGPSGTGPLTRDVVMMTGKENYSFRFTANVTP